MAATLSEINMCVGRASMNSVLASVNFHIKRVARKSFQNILMKVQHLFVHAEYCG